MKYVRKIAGKRCYLSPMSADDAERYVEWFNDLEVSRTLTLAPAMIGIAVEREAIDRLSREHNYAIVDTATDTLIGNCGFAGIDNLNRSAEAGIVIGDRSHWDRGYGSEALDLLAGYGFDYLNLHSVTLRVYSFNERAIACYRKAGFKECGRLREALYRFGAWHDIIMMDLLEGEFRATAPEPPARQA